jgi:hypothetical protein
MYPSSLLCELKKREKEDEPEHVYVRSCQQSEHANGTASYLLYSTAFATMFSLMERMTP